MLQWWTATQRQHCNDAFQVYHWSQRHTATILSTISVFQAVLYTVACNGYIGPFAVHDYSCALGFLFFSFFLSFFLFFIIIFLFWFCVVFQYKLCIMHCILSGVNFAVMNDYCLLLKIHSREVLFPFLSFFLRSSSLWKIHLNDFVQVVWMHALELIHKNE